MAASTLETVETAAIEATAIEATQQQPNIWVLALSLALVPAVVIGFGRFAYGLVLPAMRADLGWNYSQSGALNTANAVGYLSGALLTAVAVKRFSSRGVMLWGLAASVVALMLAGLMRSFALLLLCRLLVGTSAGFANICATALAARLGKDDRENALALGLVVSGPSLGVVFTGATLPFLLAGENERWPWAWLLLAGVGLVGFLVALRGTGSLAAGAEPRSDALPDALPDAQNSVSDSRALWPAYASYFGFGLGYIAYMTFLTAYVRSMGATPAMVALTWITLGAGMILSPWLWRTRLARETGGGSLALMGVCGALSSGLLLFSTALPVLLLSAFGFGLTSMAVFTAVTLLIRRHLPRPQWTGGIATATIIFAVGQSLGPIGSGYLSDFFDERAPLVWTAVIMLLAGAAALRQKPLR